MSKTASERIISPEKEKELWRQHHIDSLLEWADLPFTRKIQMLEDMVEVARAFHGGKLPLSPDEHDERTTL
jgi:hypothetical protein